MVVNNTTIYCLTKQQKYVSTNTSYYFVSTQQINITLYCFFTFYKDL